MRVSLIEEQPAEQAELGRPGAVRARHAAGSRRGLGGGEQGRIDARVVGITRLARPLDSKNSRGKDRRA